jgi:hypothetical protein
MWTKGYKATVELGRYWVEVSPPAILDGDYRALAQKASGCRRFAEDKAEILPSASTYALGLAGAVIRGREFEKAVEHFGGCLGPEYVVKQWKRDEAQTAGTTAR